MTKATKSIFIFFFGISNKGYQNTEPLVNANTTQHIESDSYILNSIREAFTQSTKTSKLQTTKQSQKNSSLPSTIHKSSRMQEYYITCIKRQSKQSIDHPIYRYLILMNISNQIKEKKRIEKKKKKKEEGSVLTTRAFALVLNQDLPVWSLIGSCYSLYFLSSLPHHCFRCCCQCHSHYCWSLQLTPMSYQMAMEMATRF